MSDTLVSSADRTVERLAYSIDEVMQATSLGRTTVAALIRTGDLRSIAVGRRRLIPATALHEFIDGERAS